MKIYSFYKQAIRTVQLYLVAFICSVALSFSTAAPSLAAQLQVAPTPPLAIFGWGEKEKVEGKVEKFISKAQAKIGKKLEDTAKQSSLTKGTEQLPKIDAAAQQVAERSSPMGLKEIEARSKGGLNEIQGSADANKMHKADTSKPGAAMAEKIDKALDKVTK